MAITINLNVSQRGGGKHHRRERKELIMAVKNLTLAVDRLTAAVDRTVAGGGNGGGVPQEEIDAEAARVDEQSQRLEALPSSGGVVSDAAPGAHRPK